MSNKKKHEVRIENSDGYSISYRHEEIDIEVGDLTGEPLTTFGGAFQSDDFEMDDFGIQAGALCITGFTQRDFANLAVSMVNHLILNGCDFEVVDIDEQDQKREIKIKCKNK